MIDNCRLTLVEHLEASTAPMLLAQLRVLGGAMARVAAEAQRLRPPCQPAHASRVADELGPARQSIGGQLHAP
jgi:hypothetical protein